MCKRYHLTPEAAFFILRPVILDPRICASQPTGADGELVAAPAPAAATPAVAAAAPAAAAAAAPATGKTVTKAKDKKGAEEALSKGLYRQLGLAAQQLLPASACERHMCRPSGSLTVRLLRAGTSITPSFYVTFWSLSMTELHVPKVCGARRPPARPPTC
jgi:hypothetical protein